MNPAITKAIAQLGRVVAQELAVQAIKHGPTIANKIVTYGGRAVRRVKSKKL